MKVLIDECAPRSLKHALAADGYDCVTVQEAGWSGKVNGGAFGVGRGRVRGSDNARYQSQLSTEFGRTDNRCCGSPRAIKSAHPPQDTFSTCSKALQSIKAGEIVYVGAAE